MGYMTDGLTFNTLRSANLKRVTGFRDAKGRLSHPKEEGGLNTWTPADWMLAVVGELGELANLLKKVKRGDFSFEEKRQEIEDEFADVQTYLDLLAASVEVDLGKVTIDKFNRISKRVASPILIREDGSDWKYDLLFSGVLGDDEDNEDED